MALDSDLREAYELKNALDVWLKTSTVDNAKTRLEAWMTEVDKWINMETKHLKKWFKH